MVGQALVAPSARAYVEETVGGTTNTGNASNHCILVQLEVQSQVSLMGWSHFLDNSNGRQLTFEIYEKNSSGDFVRRDEVTRTKVGTIGGLSSGFGWESSPTMVVTLEGGKEYGLATCWGPQAQIQWQQAPASGIPPGENTVFGRVLARAGAAPATGSTQNFTVSNLLPIMRLQTSVGATFRTDPPSASDLVASSNSANESLFEGHLYSVDQDVVLHGAAQTVSVDGQTNGSTVFQVRECSRPTGQSSYNCDAPSSAVAGLQGSSSSAPEDQTSGSLFSEQLEAGKTYFIGIRSQDPSVRSRYYTTTTLTHPSWGTTLGNGFCYSGCAAAGTDTVQLTASSGHLVPQAVLAVRGVLDRDDVEGTTSISAHKSQFGNVFFVDRNTSLQFAGLGFNVESRTEVRFGLYKSTTGAEGPFELEQDAEVEVEGDEQIVWDAGPMDAELVAGNHYLLLAWFGANGFSGLDGYVISGNSAVQQTAFGSWVSGYSDGSTAFPQSVEWNSSSGADSPFDPVVAYRWQLETCEACADIDNDGIAADIDCDDNDPANIVARSDVDEDGVSTCDGDCDDGDASVSPEMSEEYCDGVTMTVT